MLNDVCLMGRICTELELKYTQSQIAVTSFSIAVDRTFQSKGQEKQTDFITIVAWRNTAEFITKYFHKGSMIAIQGSIQTRQYTDRNGNKRTAFEVVADQAFFAESKRDKPAQASPDVSFSNSSTDFEEIVGDEVLPF